MCLVRIRLFELENVSGGWAQQYSHTTLMLDIRANIRSKNVHATDSEDLVLACPMQ